MKDNYRIQDIRSLRPCCAICASARLRVDHAEECASLCCARHDNGEVDIAGLCEGFAYSVKEGGEGR